MKIHPSSLWSRLLSRRQEPSRKRPLARRPELECLEDRTAPATWSFTNPAAIALPAAGFTSGPAAPYPSAIAVAGLTGQTAGKVTVTLHGLTHTFPDDLDIALVGPTGVKVMLVSDCGTSIDVNDVTLTLDDTAAAGLPDATQIVSGTYRPTDFETGDPFPAPGPAGAPFGTTLASFMGTDPNGTWNLFIVDDGSGDSGTLARGWSLTFNTTHRYTTPSVLNAVPGTGTSGPAAIYPAAITVPDLQGEVVTKVAVRLNGLTHNHPDDLDVLLVGPTGQSTVLMSDCGGSNGIVVVTLTFDDTTTTYLPDTAQITTGTFLSTNFGAGDAFPPPAPPAPHGGTLGAFNGTDPYGTWSLYLVDDAGLDAGSLAGGWELFLTTSSGGSAPQTLEPADYDGDGIDDMAVYRGSNGGWYILTSSSGFAGSIQRVWGALWDVPVQNSDFDGDGRADIGVFRPPGPGAVGPCGWFILTSSSGFTAPLIASWGADMDLPLQNADFDGDNRADIAVWRPTTGGWYALLSSSGFTTPLFLHWGQVGDIPLPQSDFDGDGRDDAAVYRPSSGGWFILRSGSGYTTAQVSVWGTLGDVPLPHTDFDGDGRSDVAVYRPGGSWFVLTSGSNFTAPLVRTWGTFGDLAPAGGDYDGDGRADMTVYRPGTGGWYVLTSSSGYATPLVRTWGRQGDLAIPLGNFDGLGGTDIAVWRPEDGFWYVLTSGAGSAFSVPLFRLWGTQGDRPV